MEGKRRGLRREGKRCFAVVEFSPVEVLCG